MAWTCLRESYPIARKDHACTLCGTTIQKGQAYTVRVGAGSDGIVTMRMHHSCEQATEGWDEIDFELHRDPAEFHETMILQGRIIQ